MAMLTHAALAGVIVVGLFAVAIGISRTLRAIRQRDTQIYRKDEDE